jgi:hypothetical protein
MAGRPRLRLLPGMAGMSLLLLLVVVLVGEV